MSKPSRRQRVRAPLRLNPLVFMTSSILAASAAAAADQPPSPAPSGALEEVIVTAQKHAENLQAVPISIQAIDSKHLEDLQVTSFDGYAKYLPSLSVQSFGPGYAQLYIRGVTNGGDGLHVGSQPLVGVYVDEMPVTTIASNLDVHIYDMARVEALSGPQGTLYGSSSMAGTLRLITNKPSTTGFEAGYDLTANTFTGHGAGGKIEGFVNIPLTEHAAIRLVAFTEHDGGYISNVQGPPETYPTSGIVRSNAALLKKDFNAVQTSGGRAAMKIDFADHWTITPSVMLQNQTSNGLFAFAPALGDLSVAQYSPNTNTDNWWSAALTIEGKISDFDVIYAGGLMNRNIHSRADYSDYSYFYDQSYVGGAYPTYFGDNFRDNNGNLISPAQYTVNSNNYKKYSHELRFATPKDWRMHGVLGLFLQRQFNYARDEYHVDGLADAYSITNLPGVLYLNSQRRTDRDKAVFTDWTYDVSDKLALTGGIRYFGFDNTVYGYFGYNGQPTFDGYTHGSGEQLCFPGTTAGAGDTRWPCADINSRATDHGETHRLNITYKFDPDHMVYATWSTGFRPGGVNRVRTRPSYQPDYLTNVEAGWKTEWFDHRVRFNGAVFDELWKGAQFALIGANGITEITNAGRSRIVGIESDITWKVTSDFTLSASGTLLRAKLLDNACNRVSADFSCSDPGNKILAPAGSRLPVSSKINGNMIARYEFKVSDFDAHLQAALVAKSDAIPALTVSDAQVTGNQPGYASLDLAAGFRRGNWETELYAQNVTDNRGQGLRYTECAPGVCPLVYVVPIAPRLVGITFGQKF